MSGSDPSDVGEKEGQGEDRERGFALQDELWGGVKESIEKTLRKHLVLKDLDFKWGDDTRMMIHPATEEIRSDGSTQRERTIVTLRLSLLVVELPGDRSITIDLRKRR